jgi:hypothetical protein
MVPLYALLAAGAVVGSSWLQHRVNLYWRRRKFVRPLLERAAGQGAFDWSIVEEPGVLVSQSKHRVSVLEAQIDGRRVERTLRFVDKPERHSKNDTSIYVWELRGPFARQVLDDDFSIAREDTTWNPLDAAYTSDQVASAPVGPALIPRGDASTYRRLVECDPYIAELVEQLGQTHFSMGIDSEAIYVVARTEYQGEEDIGLSLRMMLELAESMEAAYIDVTGSS